MGSVAISRWWMKKGEFIIVCYWKKKLKNIMSPFHVWGSTASRLEPLRGGSLLFTTKFPEISGTQE